MISRHAPRLRFKRYTTNGPHDVPADFAALVSITVVTGTCGAYYDDGGAACYVMSLLGAQAHAQATTPLPARAQNSAGTMRSLKLIGATTPDFTIAYIPRDDA